MIFFETFPECSLPGTVLKKQMIKMIGHHARLRDVSVLVPIMHVIQQSMLHFVVA